MADAYGINDTSLLSGDNAATARSIQDAFTRSKLARDRQGLRYGLPQLSSFNEDNALAQAQKTAEILNNNQQLQNAIDASHHTPHGIAENLAAYGPTLSSLLRLSPALFGTNTMGALGREGLIPAATRTVKSWFKDPNTGQTYGLDGMGKVVTAYDPQGNVIPGFGMYDRGTGSLSDYPNPNLSSGWPTGAGGDVNFGSDFGANAGDFGGAVTTPYIPEPPIDWGTGFGEAAVDNFGGLF